MTEPDPRRASGQLVALLVVIGLLVAVVAAVVARALRSKDRIIAGNFEQLQQRLRRAGCFVCACEFPMFGHGQFAMARFGGRVTLAYDERDFFYLLVEEENDRIPALWLWLENGTLTAASSPTRFRPARIVSIRDTEKAIGQPSFDTFREVAEKSNVGPPIFPSMIAVREVSAGDLEVEHSKAGVTLHGRRAQLPAKYAELLNELVQSIVIRLSADGGSIESVSLQYQGEPDIHETVRFTSAVFGHCPRELLRFPDPEWVRTVELQPTSEAQLVSALQEVFY
jgi:hypothetical protein